MRAFRYDAGHLKPTLNGARPRSIIVALALATSPAPSIAADLEVRSPSIDVHEFEYDIKHARVTSGRMTSNVHEVEYGLNKWWSTAIEGEWVKSSDSGEAMGLQSLTFENRFAFPFSKQAWGNVGLFTEYESGRGGSPSAVRVGPVVQATMGPTVNVLNVVAVKERGPGSRHNLDLAYAWQTRWILSEEFQPGFEIYGGAMDAGLKSPRQNLGGPVLFGVFDLGDRSDIRYELGYLHDFRGATGNTIKLLLGYEYRF